MADSSPAKPFFGEMADFFDWRTQTESFRERERKFLEIARLALERSSAERPLCLDLGCGPGAISLALARLGFDTIGVDSSAAMVELATKAATESREGNGRCTFKCMDLGKFLEGFSGEADLIVSSSVFEYLGDPTRTLQLVAGRLRTGGTFATSVPNMGSVYRWVEPALLLRTPRHLRYRREWRNSMRARQLIKKGRTFGLEPVQKSHFGQIVIKGRPLLARFTRFPLIGTMTLVVLVRR
ncbi:MAG: class I SAM-dependent methyltransferase [Actinobacteria bacterium]|nr:class I SAM-dependent methyltransferase [Actinomycetota bacterium]